MLNVKKTLTKILDLFNVPLQIAQSNATQTISPGSGTYYLPISVPSGYKGIAIAGFSVNYAECSVNMCYWDEPNSRIVIQVRNNYTAPLSVNVTGQLLCYKLGGGTS